MIETKVLQLTDAAAIELFERTRLLQFIEDESDRELHSWHSSWRKESLEHYLPLGWSFGVWEDAKLVGYFIAQPQLFVRGMTQTLWIERLVANKSQISNDLIELAYKLCREKHFQKALFHLHEDTQITHSVYQLSSINENLLELKTAKF